MNAKTMMTESFAWPSTPDRTDRYLRRSLETVENATYLISAGHERLA